VSAVAAEPALAAHEQCLTGGVNVDTDLEVALSVLAGHSARRCGTRSLRHWDAQVEWRDGQVPGTIVPAVLRVSALELLSTLLGRPGAGQRPGTPAR
jgi:hypothetical protein